jgi:hypothetical protein
MKDHVILRASDNPIRMSYLAAMLIGEGLEAEVQNVKTGVWRLVVPAGEAALARSVLRDLQSEGG